MLFKDCVWNFETGSREPFNPEYFFTVGLARVHCDVKNQAVYDTVMRRLFEDTQDDPVIRKEFLKHLSVAATGKHNARCFISNIGFSGTGKSTLIKMMKFAYPGCDVRYPVFTVVL